MSTRAQYFNSRGRSLGDLLALQESQSGWHLISDHERMAFWSDSIEGGTHPMYPEEITSLATCIAYLNEVKTNYTAHIADTDVHSAADGTNTVSAADASDLATSITLANELKTDLNNHMAGGASGASHTHAITVAAHTHALALKSGLGAIDGVVGGTNQLGFVAGSDVTVAGAGADGGVANTTATATAGAASGAATSYHRNADNINTITVANASTLATLESLTLALVTAFRNHLFIGAMRMDEAV